MKNLSLIIALFFTSIFINLQAQAPGNSLNFDGANDYVDTGTPVFGAINGTVANFTIEAWIKPNATDNDGLYHAFLGGDATGGRNPGIWVISNKIHCSEQAGGFLSPTAVFNQDKWNHVAWVKSGINNVVYVNGKIVGTWLTSATATIYKNYTIGYIDNYFSGNIDEVRFWNYSLSQSAIQANMFNEISPTTSGLLKYYKFNSTSGTSLVESVSGATNGTLNNFTLSGTTSNWAESYAMVVPTAFTTTNATATSFTANWAAPVAGSVDAYLLDVSTSPNFDTFVSGFNGLNVGAVTTYNVTGLTSNAANSYYWRVRANKTTVTGQGVSPLKGANAIAPTPPGNALHFDGSNDFVGIGNNASIIGSNAFALEAWIKTTSTARGVILQQRDATSIVGQYSLELNANGTVYFWLYNTSMSQVTSTQVVNDGRWHHIAATRESDFSLKIYIDGNLVASALQTSQPLTSLYVAIGKDYRDNNGFFNGNIDEVRIYNVARSQSEIQADMYSTATTNLPDGLLAYYKMDQGTAGGTNTGLTNLSDQSVNGFTGTLSGFNLSGATSNWVESYAQITPTNLTTTSIAPTSFTANWAASSIGTTTSYVIDVATDTAFANLVTNYSAKNVGNVLTTNITGLVNTTKYYWRVRADKASVTGTGNNTAYQTVTTTFQKPGKALNFDGVDDRIIATGTQPSPNMTVEAWIKSSSTTLQEIVGFSSSNSTKVTEFRINGNKLCIGSNGNGAPVWNELCGNTTINTGRWTHVAVVKTGTSYSLYVNGVLDGSSTLNIVDPVTDRITIGSFQQNGTWAPSYTFNGNIDEVRIWSVAKTQAELQASMYDEISASATGLVRYYNFNTSADGGATLTDSVTTAPANGTLSNFALTGTTSNWVESYAMVVPTALTNTTINYTGFTANWTAPVPGTVENYLLDVSIDPAFGSFVSGYNALNIGTVTSYNVTGLSQSTTYYWRVRANKTTVTGQASYSSVKTVNIPQEPLNVSSTTTTNTLNLLTNAAVIVDPNVTINYTNAISGFSVVLSNGKQNGDVLSYTGTLPSGVSATAYNSSTGVLSFTGTTTAANWQTLLRTVTFRAYTNAGVNRSISFSAGSLNSFNNGHYYEFVAASGGTWTNAKAGAAAKRYLNYTGYLATITSQAENDFIKQILNSNSWIGASSDYNLINTLLGTTAYASQSAAIGKWYWVTGPEAGTQFMSSNTVTIPGRFSNWYTGEPNSSGGENFAGLYSTLDAKWNDFADTNTGLGGYIVEYGGLSNDIVQTPSYSLTMSVSGTPPGNALSFDGTNDYVQIPSYDPFGGNFTIETWIKSTSAAGRSNIVSWGSSTSNGSVVEFRLANGKLQMLCNGATGNGSVTSFADVNTGKWMHVAVVKNSNSYSLYINGILDGTSTIAYSGYSFNTLTLGGLYYAATWFNDAFFPGSMDEMRFWNTARSQTEIQNNMYNVVAPTTSGLINYYNFDQGNPSGTNSGNTTLFDQTSNGRNGTMSGFALSGTTSNWVESYAMVVPEPATTNAIVFNGFTANWSASTIGSFDNYILEVSTNVGFTSFVTGYNNKNVGTATSFAVTGLAPNTTYYWRVRADKTSVTGQGGYSTQTVVTLKEPINITSTTTSNSFNLLTNAAIVVDPNLTINYSQNIEGFRVIINTNKQDGDVLAYTGTLPSGITAVPYNSSTGVLAFTGTTSAANWQAFLRTVTFRAYKNSGVARSISFSAGTLNSFSNGHFYEYIASSAITWSNAKTAAAARTYLNYSGYLTTVTSADENNFIKQILSADAWMGASDDYSHINAATGVTTYANQSTSEGKWYWVTGPEAGTQFMTANSTSAVVAGKYANWDNNEPNNGNGGIEHYGQFYSSNNASWNDLPNSYSTIAGYIVEYGGLTTDIVQTPSYSITMNVSSAQPGNALDFDGTSDYVNLGNKLSFPNTTPFTIEAWVNRKTASGGVVIGKFNGEGGASGQYVLSINTDGTINFHREVAPWSFTTTTAIPANKWSHIAATYNGTTMILYINGVASGSMASGSIGNTMNPNVYIGARECNGVPCNFFGGKIDEVRFWSVARTQAEIVANMIIPISPSATNLLSYYNFNEGITNGTNTGLTTLYDQTTTLNNGTLNSFGLTGSTTNWVESYAMVVPTTTAATSKYSLGFTANWTASSTGTTEKYYLDVATDAAFTSLVTGYSNKDVGSVTSSAVNTGLSANTTYYYRVRAEKASVTGTGAYSNTTSVTTNTTETLVATAASDRTSVSFTANWSAPTLHNISAYLLDVSTVSNFATFVSGYNGLSVTGLSQSVTGLTANTVYYYRIRVSGYNNSNTITTSTIAPFATIATSVTSICANGTQPTITFTGSGSVAPYTFTYTINSGSNQTVTTTSGNSVTVSVPTATSGVYTYSLVNVADANSGSNSQTGSVVVTVNPTPVPTFSSAPAATICSSINTTYTTQSGQTNYSWSVPGTLNTDYIITSGGIGTSSSTVTLKWLTSGSKVVTVNYTNSTGCASVNPASATTSVSLTPTVASITGTTTTTVGLSTTLANTTVGGVWSSSNAAIASINSSGVVTAVGQGTATITYTVTSGSCGNFVTTTYTVNAAPAPTITSVSPLNPVVGATVTVTGTNFLGASLVTVGTYQVTFTVVSATSITFVLPTGSGTNLAVAVTTPGGTATSISPNLITYNTAGLPTITSFTPTSAGSGQTVVITGTNLTNPSTITFGGTDVASYTVNSATQITVVIGSGTTGSVVVTTAHPTPATANTNFTYLTCGGNPTLYSGGAITICASQSPLNITTDSNASNYSALSWTTSGNGTFANNTTVNALTSTTYSPSAADITAGSVTLTLTATANSGCIDATSSKVLTLKPITVAGSISPANANVCYGSTSGLLTLTGHSGNVVRWESSVSPFTTWTTIANTSTIFTSGVLNETTKFRAVVNNNSCGEENATPATISINSSTYDGTSWSNGTPDSTTSAFFTGNYTITSNFNACSIKVSNNAAVTVNSTNNVYLNGAITVETGSSFTMNNSTNLLQSDANAINSGNIIVKRNSSLIRRLDHTLWSSPVTGQNLFSFSPNTLTNRFYVYNTATNSYVNTGLSNSSLFTTAKGFGVRAPNTQSDTTPAEWTGTFTGVPNNGTKYFTLATNAANEYHYNLVGNPYPSTINATDFYNANSTKIEGTLYFYAHTLSMNAIGLFPIGTNYATWTGLGGTAATLGDGQTPAEIPNGIIQVGQGFIVKAIAAGDLTFTNSMRTANQANQFMRNNTTTPEIHRMWLNLKSDTGVDINQILVGYMDGATQGVDANLDGLSFGNTGSYLYSKIENNNYVIQARSLPFDGTDEVSLGFNCATAGSYKIKLTNTDGLFAGTQDVLVRDLLTGTETSIKTTPYTFTSDAGVFDNRFKLVYTQALGIPSTNFTENSVIVYKNTDWFHVTTKGIAMKDIMVYDISGRLLYSLKDIYATNAILNGLATSNQVLFLKITSQEGNTVTIKVIN